LSDSTLSVSSFDIFFLTSGFSKTIFKEDPLLLILLPVNNKEFRVVVNATLEEIQAAMAMGRSFIATRVPWR
jgi:hypothetical protein